MSPPLRAGGWPERPAPFPSTGTPVNVVAVEYDGGDVTTYNFYLDGPVTPTPGAEPNIELSVDGITWYTGDNTSEDEGTNFDINVPELLLAATQWRILTDPTTAPASATYAWEIPQSGSTTEA